MWTPEPIKACFSRRSKILSEEISVLISPLFCNADDSESDPADHRHRHRIAQCAIPRAVRGGLAAIGNEGVAVGKALQAFAFGGGEAAHRHTVGNDIAQSEIVPALVRIGALLVR